MKPRHESKPPLAIVFASDSEPDETLTAARQSADAARSLSRELAAKYDRQSRLHARTQAALHEVQAALREVQAALHEVQAAHARDQATFAEVAQQLNDARLAHRRDLSYHAVHRFRATKDLLLPHDSLSRAVYELVLARVKRAVL